MNIDVIIAFCLFGFATSITPGPNNIMLLASGMNFGVKRTMPHILGITAGFFSLVYLVGTVLGALFLKYELLHQVLRLSGAAYLCYLAWDLAMSQPSSPSKSVEECRRPMEPWQAATFQWINPKAWIMAIGATSTYLPAEADQLQILWLAISFALINLPCALTWTILGQHLRRMIQSPVGLKRFNRTMAALLLASLGPLLIEALE